MFDDFFPSEVNVFALGESGADCKPGRNKFETKTYRNVSSSLLIYYIGWFNYQVDTKNIKRNMFDAIFRFKGIFSIESFLNEF